MLVQHLAGCTNLSTINIPNTITSIGKYAFSNCINVSTINIPKSVTTIETFAFVGWQTGQIINCEILYTEGPDTWDEKWNYNAIYTKPKATINWGVSM